MPFCGLGLGDAVPDGQTPWDVRAALIAARSLDRVFARLAQEISLAGSLPISGQIVDAAPVTAQRWCDSDAEPAAIKSGQRTAGNAHSTRLRCRLGGGL